MNWWQVSLLLVAAAIPSRAQINSPPTFSSANYTAVLSEDASDGTVLGVTIEATDDDGVEYSITSGGDIFSINATSGEIKVLNNNLIDYETSSTITVVVQATDKNAEPASSSVDLLVTLLNVNDNAPVFDDITYNFTAVEEEFSLVVGTIRATDLDGDDLEYGFQDNSLSEFTLLTETNVATLTTTTKLDYEVQTSFTFSVFVSDGVNDHVVYATVTVNVIDIIDLRPVIKPVASELLIDLDNSQQTVEMSHLEVTDDDNLYSGKAEVKYIFDNVESVSCQYVHYMMHSFSYI